MVSGMRVAPDDEARVGRPLRHARFETFSDSFALESGGRLDELRVCYETWGELSPACDNVVLVCHALSGDSHVARHDDEDDAGWWESVVGPGKPVDTDRYFVVCSNVLGGCRGTTGPNSINPRTGSRFGADFPTVTVGDMVRVQAMLLRRIGVDRALAVIGGSLGGFQALEWATKYGDRIDGCIGLATAPRLSSQAIAFDVVGRNAITHDPNYNDGKYYDADTDPSAGLALARMLAHITYLSSDSMERKFNLSRLAPREVATEFEKKFSVGTYLAHQGHKFVERFDANSYVTLSMAMDLFDLGSTTDELDESLRPVTAASLLVSFSSDWLYPPADCRLVVDTLARRNKRVSYCEIPSDCGHDAFLLDDDLPAYGSLISSFLDRLSEQPGRGPAGPGGGYAETSIFHGERLDFDLVLDLIPAGASVLDLGCGGGELLDLLRARGHERLFGVELASSSVIDCVGRGHDVIQSDLDRGLSSFEDDQFDVAVLSQTLQAIEDVSGLLSELVRVSRHSIVSFPNFAHRPLREMFYREGRIPKSDGLYQYEWHNSPNRRFPSILDFEELCAKKGIRIETKIYIDSCTGARVVDEANLNADMAIVVLTA
jgi:homoserine O-acetyltransferase